MELKRKYICPILKKECIGLECSWIIKMEGYDINTGQKLNEWTCTVAALPKLLIENAGMQRQTGAAIDSFKDEMVSGAEKYNNIINKLKNDEE